MFSYPLDHLAQLQLTGPQCRNSSVSVLNTQQVPGAQAGAVAVTAVVDGLDHALLERARRQGAPQANSQRFFGDPPVIPKAGTSSRYLVDRI